MKKQQAPIMILKNKNKNKTNQNNKSSSFSMAFLMLSFLFVHVLLSSISASCHAFTLQSNFVSRLATKTAIKGNQSYHNGKQQLQQQLQQLQLQKGCDAMTVTTATATTTTTATAISTTATATTTLQYSFWNFHNGNDNNNYNGNKNDNNDYSSSLHFVQDINNDPFISFFLNGTTKIHSILATIMAIIIVAAPITIIQPLSYPSSYPSSYSYSYSYSSSSPPTVETTTTMAMKKLSSNKTPPNFLQPYNLQQKQQQQHHHQVKFSLPLHIQISTNSAWALTEQQLLVNDVWTQVTRQYVDPTFNGMGEEGWRKLRLEAVTKVSNVGPDDTPFVYETIRAMLSKLNDPYTRFLTPSQYETLTSYARGTTNTNNNNNNIGGIGVQLLADPKNGNIIVMNTVPKSPAEMAGIRPGDIILQVNDIIVNDASATAEVVAAQCRGEPGTEVILAIQHQGETKATAKTNDNNNNNNEITKISVKRAKLQPESVETSIVNYNNNKKIGIIKISSFSLETEQKVMDALTFLKSNNNNNNNNKGTSILSSIVLDLRGNVGGYMPAGVNVAKLFLPPNARIITEVDKAGRSTIYINDGSVASDISTPLYVIVDHRTASASEILTAALQENNHRATIIGTEKTFGKGRIQNIQELQDGSGIAITKAKYKTPLGNDIHGIGISPDIETTKTLCGPAASAEDCIKNILL